jgi:hypothetical protein
VTAGVAAVSCPCTMFGATIKQQTNTSPLAQPNRNLVMILLNPDV